MRRASSTCRVSRAATTPFIRACCAPSNLVSALREGRANDELASYDAAWRSSAVGEDLKPVRNVKPLWSKFGTLLGIGLGGLDMWMNQLFKSSFFGTMSHGKPDHATLKPIDQVKHLSYPKPDGVLTFDNALLVFPPPTRITRKSSPAT